MIKTKIFFFVSASNPFNSIRIQINLISNLLEELFDVEAEIIHPGIQNFEVILKNVILKDEILFWHYGGLDIHFNVLNRNNNITFVYHNITPPKFFWKTDPLVSIRSILGKIQLRMMRKKNRWITMSDYNVNELRDIGFKDVILCPNIISKKTIILLQKSKEITLIYVGRISPNKNCIFLLEQVEKVANQLLRPIKLVVVGTTKEGCKYGISFLKKFESLKSNPYLVINWKKDIQNEELNCLYQESWLYLSTSLHEGFGVPACESIANGTPAIYLESGGQESVLNSIGLVKEKDLFYSHIIDLILESKKLEELLEKQKKIVNKLIQPEINKKVFEIYRDIIN
jgi:glycosyltransferase involved in cell wall biosynthesis